MKKNRKLRIYMDFACPFCYNEFKFMEKIKDQAKDNWEIEYYGWELNPTIPEDGFLIDQEKFSETAKKLNKLGESVGVRPGDIKYIFNTNKALQLLEEAKLQGEKIAHDFIAAVFYAYFEAKINIAKDEVILPIAEKVGIKDAYNVLKENRHAKTLVEHDKYCHEIQLPYIPAIEENGEIILMGVLSLADVEKEFGR